MTPREPLHLDPDPLFFEEEPRPTRPDPGRDEEPPFDWTWLASRFSRLLRWLGLPRG